MNGCVVSGIGVCVIGDALVVVIAGPYTMAGPGETCLICEDPLGRGDSYMFATWSGQSGVAHENCTESPG